MTLGTKAWYLFHASAFYPMVNSIITACPFKDCHFLYKNTDDKAEKDWDLDNQYNPVDVDNNTFSIRLKGSTKRWFVVW